VTPAEVRRTLAPAGALWAPVGGAAPAPTEAWLPLDPWMLTEAAQDRQVRGYLAWRDYIDASWSCELGFHQRASARLAELQKLVPDDQRLAELSKKCN